MRMIPWIEVEGSVEDGMINAVVGEFDDGNEVEWVNVDILDKSGMANIVCL